MAQTLRFPLLALALLALAGCATLQQQFKQPEVAVERVNISRMSLADMDLDVVLGVNNPNPIGLSLAGMNYRLELDQHKMIEGRSDQRIKMAAGGDSTVTLPVSLNYADLLNGLSALSGRQSIPYTLSGDMNFGLFSVPYSHRGELQLPSLPSISIESLRVDKFNLSGVRLLLSLGMENANSFPIRLNGMNYDLSLAGNTVSRGESMGPIEVAAGGKGRSELAIDLDYGSLGNLFNTLSRGSSVPVALDAKLLVPALRGEQTLPMQWSGDVGITR